MSIDDFSFLLLYTDIPRITSDRGVDVKLSNGDIEVSWDNSNTLGEIMSGFKSNSFTIKNNEIQKIQVLLKPDTSDDINYVGWNPPEYSTITIYHSDQHNVVPYFSTTFGTEKQYWALAFKKHFEAISSIFVLTEKEKDLVIDYTQLKELKELNQSRFYRSNC